jgi:hypothetical protein
LGKNPSAVTKGVPDIFSEGCPLEKEEQKEQLFKKSKIEEENVPPVCYTFF